MVDILDILRIAKDDTVRNVAAMDVLANGKKRAMEIDTPPPISKQILSYIFAKLSTPPNTPSNSCVGKGTTLLDKVAKAEAQVQRSCGGVSDECCEISPDAYIRPCGEASGVVEHEISKDCLEMGENDKPLSCLEEKGTDTEDLEGSSKSQEEKTSSSSNEQDYPSKYFRCLSIENDQESHFLYGLVVPLVARILLVSCPNIMCIVEIPVIERDKQASQASSSDESFPSTNSSPDELNAEYCRSSSSESRGSIRLQSGETSQRENPPSKKSSERGSTLGGSFNCSFIKDPVKREKAAQLISSSLEALTAKVHIPHHDESEFTLSRVQPCRHRYVRDKKSRTLCGAMVEYTNASTCEVTVDDAFRVLALRRPDLNTPILLFTFDCDSHERMFHECLGYTNSFIIDIKRNEKFGDDSLNTNEKLQICKRLLPRRLSSRELPINCNNEKYSSEQRDKSISRQRPHALRRSRSLSLFDKSKENRTGEKRERSPKVSYSFAHDGGKFYQKHAKLESDIPTELYKGCGTGSVSNGLLDTFFTERVASPSDPTVLKKKESCLLSNVSPHFICRDSDQKSVYSCYEQSSPEMSTSLVATSSNTSKVSNNSFPFQGTSVFPATSNLSTASSGPVFSAPIGSFPLTTQYSGAFDRFSYYPFELVYYPGPLMQGYKLNTYQPLSDAASSGYNPVDWNGSRRNPVFASGQCVTGQISSGYQSPRQYSFPVHETQMSYMDKVAKWYAFSSDTSCENGMKPSPVFREMRSPTFSDTVATNPSGTNANSDDDSFMRKVASEALAMLGESHGDESSHPHDEST
jgi:hypothetical protein